MQESDSGKIRIDDPADLIAAIPHFFGFYPQNSFVIIQWKDDEKLPVLRADIPAAGEYAALADQLLAVISKMGATHLQVLVIQDGPDDQSLPHREFVELLSAAEGVDEFSALWTQSTRFGTRWRCYGPCDCWGLVSDPDTGALAERNATQGKVVYGSRADVAATLQPQEDPTTLERRTALADQIRSRADLDVEQVNAIIGAAFRGSLPTSDRDIVALAVALADDDVRDQCFAHLDTPWVAEAIELWKLMVREAPPGLRAAPACLLAVFVFSQGDGVLANIALDVALQDDPDSRFAALFRQCLGLGISPGKLLELIRSRIERGGDDEQ